MWTSILPLVRPSTRRSTSRRHQVELKVVREEMMKAFNEKDEETRRELEDETRKLQEQMNRMKMDSEGMASNYSMQEEMRAMQEQARREREQAEAAYKQQMDDLNRRSTRGENKRPRCRESGDEKTA